MKLDSGSIRLSSDYLYHFKCDVEVLKLILRHGFRHSSWPETLPFFDISQNTFIVCFCDIRPQESLWHRKCYGQNAIALSKEWGIKQNISPVRYIHRTSPGVSEDYISLKTLYRSARELEPHQPEKTLLFYLVNCLLEESGDLLDGDLKKTVAVNPNIRLLAQGAQKRFVHALGEAGKVGVREEFIHFLDLMMDKIHDLHNELEMRDSYMRAYSHDFTSPATNQLIENKVLYDEREWRSIKFLNLSETLSDKKLLESAVKQGFLPSEYNLKFTDEDVIAVLAEDDCAKEKLIREIKSGETLLSPAMTSKVYLFEEFAEQEPPNQLLDGLDASIPDAST